MSDAWRCDGCGTRMSGGTYVRRGRLEDRPAPKACTKCGADRPPVARDLPPVLLVFCNLCGCTYPGSCAVHTPAEGGYSP